MFSHRRLSGLIWMTLATALTGCSDDKPTAVETGPGGSSGGGVGNATFDGTWNVTETWRGCGLGTFMVDEYELDLEVSNNRVLIDGQDLGIALDGDSFVIEGEMYLEAEDARVEWEIEIALVSENHAKGTGEGEIILGDGSSCDFDISVDAWRQQGRSGAAPRASSREQRLLEALAR